MNMADMRQWLNDECLAEPPEWALDNGYTLLTWATLLLVVEARESNRARWSIDAGIDRVSEELPNAGRGR